jgi:hypothetical protein
VLERTFDVGLSLQEIVDQIGPPEHLTAAVWLNGNRIMPEHFALIRPKASALIFVAILPEDSRTALLIGGSLALAALAVVAPPLALGALGMSATSLGGAALSVGIATGIAMAGQLALNAEV